MNVNNALFKEAKNFFADGGVIFPEDPKEHRYALMVIIDDTAEMIEVITPYKYKMSRYNLSKIYSMIVSDEKIGGARKVRSMIEIINVLIKDGFYSGTRRSYDIETCKHNSAIKPIEVVRLFGKIATAALEFSQGRSLKNLSEIYNVLGGPVGTWGFFQEVMKATAMSIPEEGSDIVVGNLPSIRCYTCKHCKYEHRRRMCSYASIGVSAEDIRQHPYRYVDMELVDGVGYVSSVIDERMIGCEDYEPRIK